MVLYGYYWLSGGWVGGGAVLTSLTCTSLIYYVTKLLFVVYIAHVVVWLSGGGGINVIDVHVTCILHYETCLRCTYTLHMLFNGYQGGWGGINVLDVHVTCMLLYETFVR